MNTTSWWWFWIHSNTMKTNFFNTVDHIGFGFPIWIFTGIFFFPFIRQKETTTKKWPKEKRKKYEKWIEAKNWKQKKDKEKKRLSCEIKSSIFWAAAAAFLYTWYSDDDVLEGKKIFFFCLTVMLFKDDYYMMWKRERERESGRAQRYR